MTAGACGSQKDKRMLVFQGGQTAGGIAAAAETDFGVTGLVRGCSDTTDTGHLSAGCYGNRLHPGCFLAFCMLAS